MVLAPVVGGLLAMPAGLLLQLLGQGLLGSSGEGLLGRGGSAGPVPALLAAALVVGVLALLTRGMHLDGLADTADGLGSGRSAAAALDVMRRGDVGPFGVVTLVLVLLVQVLALGALTERGLGVAGLCLALVVSRLALAVACYRGVPAARPDGLGHVVAGTVGPARLASSAGLALVTLAALSLLTPGLDALGPTVLLRAMGTSAVALVAGALLVRRAVRRLGGVTGDVLGAAVEVTFTAALVVLVVVT